ncbi:MAG: hypothetical protein K2K60_03695 [Clostridia bacterium]|nr:hypothetical protein [Clostridia bacterium]
MKSVIEEIYYGNRGHSESIRESEEYFKVQREVGTLCEEFDKTLTEEQRQVFDKIHFLLSGLEAEATATHFKEGFKLGMLVAVESMN